MAGKIYIRKGRVPLFSLPFVALLLVVASCLFAFFGIVALVALGVLGAGASVLRRLFLGGKEKDRPRASGSEGNVIILGKDDYEIRDTD